MSEKIATIKYNKKHDRYVVVFPVGYGMPSGMYFATEELACDFIRSKGWTVGSSTLNVR